MNSFRRRLMADTFIVPEGAVDLGLPSRTLWAKGNIVKDSQGNYSMGSETDYGCLFYWADVTGYNQSENHNWSQNDYNTHPGSARGNAGYDIIVGDATNDAARARLGSPWMLPTNDNFKELTAYCTHTWVEMDGVKGLKFTSNIQGYTNKYIFFPATGDGYNGNSYDGYRTHSIYSSAKSNDPGSCIFLRATSSDYNDSRAGSACIGRPVRAVCKI